MTLLIEAYRDIFYYREIPNLPALGGMLVFSVLILWVSTQIFESRREEFAELV